MSIQDRLTLKSYFQKGKLPTEGNFSDLIDSMVNRQDDAGTQPAGSLVAVPDEDMQTGGTDQKRLITFYTDKDSLQNQKPAWLLEHKEQQQGLSFSEPGADPVSGTDSRLFLQAGGKVGVGTVTPSQMLDVNGTVAMQGRAGTYAGAGAEVPADGKWYVILSGFKGAEVLEIVATAINKKARASMFYGIALAVPDKGGSVKRLFRTGWPWRHIQFRWCTEGGSGSLEIRTRRNYGTGCTVSYAVTRILQNITPAAAQQATTPQQA